MDDDLRLAPPPPRVAIVKELPGECPSCKSGFVQFEDGTDNIVKFNPIECCPDIQRCEARCGKRTRRCTACAGDDWNFGDCDVCGKNGFCDIIGLKEPHEENAHRALSVCYKCGTSGKYGREWQKTSWEKEKTSREKTKNQLGIKRQGKGIGKRTHLASSVKGKGMGKRKV